MSTKIAKSNKTAAKSNTIKKNGAAKKPNLIQEATDNFNSEGDLKNIPIEAIDFSPLNYRKFFSEAALNDFAIELAVHGIISPLTLRLMPTGRYELVAGERRLRAAQIAGLKEVPAIIKALTDAQVIELQLAENIQRENPHPMNEAQGIGQMQQTYKTVEKIAARLGKSKTFVYSRIRLLALIVPIQEMFFADVIDMQEAFDIAALSAESQQEFFEQYCTDWKDEEDFSISNLRYALSRFKYDLKNAPFDTKDKKLVPEMGACTNCPFNSATLKSLFPELAEQAICTKKDCYQSKCNIHLTQLFTNAFETHQPQAIIYNWALSESLQQLLAAIPGTDALPRYGKNEISIIVAPSLPDKTDFTNDGFAYDDDEEDFEDDESFNETEEMPGFDEAGYNAAIYEYEADLEEYNRLIEKGELLKGLLVSETKAQMVMFSLDAPKQSNNSKTVTAKEVQEAIKAGSVTTDLLQAEIDRINSREKRAKELDLEKVQLNIHSAFMASIAEIDNVTALTSADLIAARMLVYQSLDWSARNAVDKVLFSETAVNEQDEKLPLYNVLENLSEQQYSYLIRMAIGCKSESKYPNFPTGQILWKVADGAGLDTDKIVQEQAEKATIRESKLAQRVAELETQIKLLTC